MAIGPVASASAMTLCAGLAVGALPSPAGEGAAKLYASRCAACHGASMQGAEGSPPLVGRRFVAKWAARPIERLAEKIRVTMPQDDPGTLDPKEAMVLAQAIRTANRLR